MIIILVGLAGHLTIIKPAAVVSPQVDVFDFLTSPEQGVNCQNRQDNSACLMVLITHPCSAWFQWTTEVNDDSWVHDIWWFLSRQSSQKHTVTKFLIINRKSGLTLFPAQIITSISIVWIVFIIFKNIWIQPHHSDKRNVPHRPTCRCPQLCWGRG